MNPTVNLISKPLYGGLIRLDADFSGSSSLFVINATGRALEDFRSEYFTDVNTAVRVFNRRILEVADGRIIAPWIYHLRPDQAEHLSAPVTGLLALVAVLATKDIHYDDLEGHLLPWDAVFDLGDDDSESLGIRGGGIEILRSQTDQGHDLGLYLTEHPAKTMIGRNRFVLRLASLKEAGGKPVEDNVEYFYGLGLAKRAFDLRIADDKPEPTRLGMEGGTPISHFEDRNSILLEDAVSILRSQAEQILSFMIKTGIFDKSGQLFYQLNDAYSAAYSGNLVKWLGSVVVQPDGSGIYSKDRTEPFEVHIKVEVPPTSIERREDGTIDFALCYFTAHYNHEDWHRDKDCSDLPYTDDGVENSVNAFLESLGYDGTVNWSEHGRQKAEEADFDMDYKLIDQIWPTLRATNTADAAPTLS
ncbi:hypothetical protein G6L37_01715 [Agrobacterium rubi]|nr:hypothetical protein [Agrobacterium rubi]NTF24111.1 hypothetical protein [Agrobacterium rubi]